MTVLSASPGTLAAVFAKASAGDTISLAPGDYVGAKFNSRTFATPLTVTSADPAHPARLFGINAGVGGGMIFQDLEISAQNTTDPYYSFRFGSLSNTVFRRIDWHGDPTKASLVDQVNGVYLADSHGVTFEDSAFHDLDSAILLARSDGVTVRGNSFARLDKGAVHFGQVSNLLVEGNRFYDFHAGPMTHADLVQGFTAGTAAASHDITVRGNLFVRRDGTPPQGILIQDETKTLPTANVTIEDNTFVGAQWNSIVTRGVTGVVMITGNTVASWPGADPDPSKTAPVPFVGRIWVEGAPGMVLTLTGNRAQGYIIPGVPAGQVPAGNTLLPADTDHGAALALEWALTHTGSGTAGPAA